MQNDNEQAQLNREYSVEMKKLEIQQRAEIDHAEIQLKQLESKWRSWLKLPYTLIRLPLFILLGVAYIVCCFTKYQPPKAFWDLLR